MKTPTIERDKSTNEPLQLSTLPMEMEKFTFDDIDELVIKKSVDEKDKNQLQVEEDESCSIHSLSCMQQERQPFPFHKRCFGERSMVYKDIDVIEHVENLIVWIW